jgi:hypothetical protein
VTFTAITLCVASQRVFIAVSVYFFIDSVRKLLDILSYYCSVGIFTVTSILLQATFSGVHMSFKYSYNRTNFPVHCKYDPRKCSIEPG